MRSAITAVAVAAVLAAGAGACSSSGAQQPAAAQAPATQAGPANPVGVLKMAGAKTTAVHGDEDVYGDLDAQGDLPGATVPGCNISYSSSGACVESIIVYTYRTQADQQRGDQQVQTTDSQVIINGNLFQLILYPVAGVDNVNKYPVSPWTIAARVHGTVQP